MKRNAAVSPVGPDEIRSHETALLRGWPPRINHTLDGWEVGVSGAYTRRANCILPLASGVLHLDDRLDQAEAYYAERGLRAVFKMHAAAEPPELDRTLALRGYARASETMVMSRSLEPGIKGSPSDADSQPDSDSALGSVLIEDGIKDDWFQASVAFSGVVAQERADYRSLLEHASRKVDASLFGSFTLKGGLASVALGCIVAETVSFVQVATAESVRRNGCARRVLEALLIRSAEQGATRAILAVEADNHPARDLYARLGFEERYRYWYRILPESNEKAPPN